MQLLIYYSVILLNFNNIFCDTVKILMPNVTTNQEDAYWCTSFKLEDNHNYLTGIKPLATANIAHHMFAFGCEEPSSTEKAWNCGTYPCRGFKSIVFAWGRNAPPLDLPKDVAYRVGPKTPMKYIVVNIHYLIKVNNDSSGLAITVGNESRPYEAGILLIVPSFFIIPPKVPKFVTKVSCEYNAPKINVFAFRVHAHVHGDVNTAYKVRGGNWTELARGDPQWPQAFYPSKGVYDLQPGDTIVGSCTFHNDENRNVYNGDTHNDEMCNIYLMFFTEHANDIPKTCSGNHNSALEALMPIESEIRPVTPAPKNDTLISIGKEENRSNVLLFVALYLSVSLLLFAIISIGIMCFNSREKIKSKYHELGIFVKTPTSENRSGFTILSNDDDEDHVTKSTKIDGLESDETE